MNQVTRQAIKEGMMEQLQKQLKRWTEILGLSHWDIVLKISGMKDPEMQEAMGKINYVLSSQVAIIKILDPADYDSEDFLQDTEKTLVHELLHIHFAMCCDPEPGTLEHILMEQKVQTLAKAFIRVDRERVQ